MARFQQDADAQALGEALATLRRAAGLSQADAGAAVGMTSQGWGLYEAGKRPGLFRPDVQRKLTAVLDASVEDLALAVARPPSDAALPSSRGVESPGRAYAMDAPAMSRAIETLQLTNDDLAPWASSGVLLEFDPGRWPRRDQGCVIDLTDGERRVRLYDRADVDTLYVRGGVGGLDHEERIPRERARRVCAVTARRES